jgi:nucleoside 2-deoxyribosyltransferase
MTIRHWCGVLAGAALFSLALCNPIWALGYPIPQEKPCLAYWDSAKAHKYVREHAQVYGYVATSHEVLARYKDGTGVWITHTEKGCLVVVKYSRSQSEALLSWLKPGRSA